MLNFYTHKLGTTALALVCLGTFSSGSVYGMDNQIEEKDKIENNSILSINPQSFIKNEIEEISSHNIIEKKPQDFYVQKDEKRDLWIGMELVTKETQAFWKQRLGWDVFVLRGDQVKEEKRFKEEMQNLSMSNGSFGINNNDSEIFQTLNYINHGSSDSGNSCYNSDDYNNENLMYWRFQDLNLSIQEQEEMEKKVTKLSKSPQGEFESAWRGFAYNLSKYNKSKHGWDIDDKRKTWVSYVCSKPVEGPLYKSFEVTSPDIRMSMTVKFGEGELKTEKLGNIFYSPLGIYASSVALAEAQKKDTVEIYKNISLPLHKNVAQFANKIDPQIKYAIVRPLKFMGSLLEKSGVLVSKEEAKFEHRSENYRYWINGISFDRDTYTWFDDSPFLGGAPQSSKREFPFVIASVKKLAELDLK